MIKWAGKRKAIEAELQHGGRIERVVLIDEEGRNVRWITSTYGQTVAPAGEVPPTYEDMAPEWLNDDMRALSWAVKA